MGRCLSKRDAYGDAAVNPVEILRSRAAHGGNYSRTLGDRAPAARSARDGDAAREVRLRSLEHTRASRASGAAVGPAETATPAPWSPTHRAPKIATRPWDFCDFFAWHADCFGAPRGDDDATEARRA
jgi:hypothetical protein